MCGRYTLFLKQSLAERYGVKGGPEARPSWNVAPGQTMPVVVGTEDGPAIEEMRWGLVPSWAKDPAIGYKMINARAETAAEKPSFRTAMKRRRCLVPASGFYEWKKDGSHKVPMFIRLRDEEPFSFAGLYERWHDAAGGILSTYTILTTSPNELMEGIHDRMPVILRREDEARWADPSNEDAGTLSALLAPFPAAQMEAYAVSDAVNRPRNNVPELITAV